MAEQIVMQRKVEGGPPAPANPLMPVAAGRITVGNLELSTIAGAAPPPERDGVDTSGSAAWTGGCKFAARSSSTSSSCRRTAACSRSAAAAASPASRSRSATGPRRS
ncbi:hypothetical protein JL720_5307 [Aureococcus anophagefferens]|nr:hypothetical protein JL720_5307 [Aureococcus anophagefferens]